MFFWHFILFLIIFNTVFVQSHQTTDRAHGIIMKDVREGVTVGGEILDKIVVFNEYGNDYGNDSESDGAAPIVIVHDGDVKNGNDDESPTANDRDAKNGNGDGALISIENDGDAQTGNFSDNQTGSVFPENDQDDVNENDDGSIKIDGESHQHDVKENYDGSIDIDGEIGQDYVNENYDGGISKEIDGENGQDDVNENDDGSIDIDGENGQDDVNENDDGSIDIDGAKRALQTGDTFTPVELLPIAKKLRAKVVEEGKGIVSGSKSPEDLADKLFASYFLTTRRIVILTDNDLSGLDALQALSVSGEVVKMRSQGDSITESPLLTYKLNGQWVGLDNQTKKCHYKVIYKKVTPAKTGLRNERKGVTKYGKKSKLEKYLGPNRHLIVNRKGRKNHNLRKPENNANKEEQKKKRIKMPHRNVRKGVNKKVAGHKKIKAQHKPGKKNNRFKPNRFKPNRFKPNRFKPNRFKNLRNKHINMPLSTTKRPNCKWRYICKIPEVLDTCRLHTSCVGDNSNKAIIDNHYVDAEEKPENEANELVIHFRKTFGLTLLDEEVEKIIEKHVLLIRPQNMNPDKKIETLEEYFNNIIMSQQLPTSPSVPDDVTDSDEKPDPDEETEDLIIGAGGNVFLNDPNNEEEQLRQQKLNHQAKFTKPMTPSRKTASTHQLNLKKTIHK